MKASEISRLKSDPILKAIYDAANAVEVKAYLVGGVLRNLVLSEPLGFDYDIALNGMAGGAANFLARMLKGSAFLLDKEHGAYRVVVKTGCGRCPHPTLHPPCFNIDLSPYKGKDIFEDLKNRDFTINAMALDISALFTESEVELLDNFNGQTDAKKKTIRMVQPAVFDDDPLRLLRAVRLSAQYNLVIEQETERVLKAKANLLTKSAWERIRDEFFAILSCPDSAIYMKMLYELGLLRAILPEIKVWEYLSGYDLLAHLLKTLEHGERLCNNLRNFAPEFADDIENEFQMALGNVAIRGLLKLALFFHDAGKPATMKMEEERIRFIGHEVEGEIISRRLGRRLKLSRSAVSFIARLVRNHHRVFNLASLEKITDRSKAHLFRAAGKSEGLFLLLLALADARATRGGEDPELAMLVKDLISFYYKVYAVKKPKPLLNGDEVMKIFNVPEGIMVGRILRKLSEAEGAGMIKNKRGAVKFIKSWLKGSEEGKL
ncbi:MAG: CCA tRNA nucleotidyltransferase [Deltaproteobacteria bacterium]|nr:CCA tRNA nucleotidyltransferase [Deltaproteobacteria bacterium]